MLSSADLPAVTSPHMLDNIKGDGKFEFSPPSTQSFYPHRDRKGEREEARLLETRGENTL